MTTKTGRFFLELGALNGELFSNTYALEHVLGWSGILIEPGTENFRQLLKNRPDDILINAAICDAPQVPPKTAPARACISPSSETPAYPGRIC